MKVSDLITKLQSLDQNKEIFIKLIDTEEDESCLIDIEETDFNTEITLDVLEGIGEVPETEHEVYVISIKSED